MLKVLAWFVSSDTKYFQTAAKILKQQHNGIEFVGVTASVEFSLAIDDKKVNFIPLAEVDGGGGIMMFCSSSVQKKSA